MNKPLILALTLSSAVLGGCGMAKELAMPDVPSDKVETIETTIAFSAESNLADNVVQLKSHKVPYSSSVVINVPQEVFEAKSQKEGQKQDFKTKDFFSEAEQAIEKSFIRNGFRVLSRAKLEAELRRLRDENRCRPEDRNCWMSQIDPEVRPILDDLEKKFKNNQITAAEYHRQVSEFKTQMQTSSRGRSRADGEKELTDISEVIRAAQSSAINADYILQINVFDTNKKTYERKDLRQNDDIRMFLRSHPEAKAMMESDSVSRLSCAIIGAELNAKLIHVKSGEIVWIGNYELNELTSGVQKLVLDFGQRTYVTNADNVRYFVQSQNTKEARKRRKKHEVQIPGWEYKTDLIIEKVAGRCADTHYISKDDRRDLARTVAGDLINTIKVQ